MCFREKETVWKKVSIVENKDLIVTRRGEASLRKLFFGRCTRRRVSFSFLPFRRPLIIFQGGFPIFSAQRQELGCHGRSLNN